MIVIHHYMSGPECSGWDITAMFSITWCINKSGTVFMRLNIVIWISDIQIALPVIFYQTCFSTIYVKQINISTYLWDLFSILSSCHWCICIVCGIMSSFHISLYNRTHLAPDRFAVFKNWRLLLRKRTYSFLLDLGVRFLL